LERKNRAKNGSLKFLGECDSAYSPRKKMSITYLHELSSFLPAVVKDLPSGIIVEYYFMNPQTEQMQRKRIRLTRLTKRYPLKRQRLLAAQQVADNLNAKLSGGWSPLHQTEDSRLYTRLSDLRQRFLAAKEAEGCRKTTILQYGSVTDLWLRWCEDNGFADRFSSTYLRQHAVRYMDAQLEQHNRNRSYNNTLKVLRSFWQWAVEHCYAKENPFIGFKTLKKEPKIRILVPPDARRKIFEHYASCRPAMNIVCQLVYSSAIRPAEIVKIQMQHICLPLHYIIIPGENAKNHKQRIATITPSIEAMLKPIVEKYTDGSLYLFGQNKDLLPAAKPVNKSYFQKSWERMRKATGLPKEMQLYSLRDTGISDLLHSGIDPLTVQHHADHSSLAIQSIYTNHTDPKVVDAIYGHAPAF